MGEIPGPSPEEQGFPEGYDPQKEVEGMFRNSPEAQEVTRDDAWDRWHTAYNKIEGSKANIYRGLAAAGLGVPATIYVGGETLGNPEILNKMLHPSVAAKETGASQMEVYAADAAAWIGLFAMALGGAYGVDRLVRGVRGMFKHSGEKRQASADLDRTYEQNPPTSSGRV